MSLSTQLSKKNWASIFFVRRFLKFFLLVALATRILRGIRISEKKGDHPRIIPMNFSEVVQEEMLFAVNYRQTPDAPWMD